MRVRGAMVCLCTACGAYGDPRLEVGQLAQRSAEDVDRVVFEVPDPCANGLGQDVEPVPGGGVELGDHGRGVAGVPVAGEDRAEVNAEESFGGESCHSRVSNLRPRRRVYVDRRTSVVHGRIGTVTPERLLAFEAAHPTPSPDRDELIRRELGSTPIRYVVLLKRAAASVEGVRADAITARRVRDRLAARALERARRTAA